MPITFIPLAVLSGTFASLSSVFAKLFSDSRTALLHDSLLQWLEKLGVPVLFPSEVALLGGCDALPSLITKPSR